MIKIQVNKTYGKFDISIEGKTPSDAVMTLPLTDKTSLVSIIKLMITDADVRRLGGILNKTENDIIEEYPLYLSMGSGTNSSILYMSLAGLQNTGLYPIDANKLCMVDIDSGVSTKLDSFKVFRAPDINTTLIGNLIPYRMYQYVITDNFDKAEKILMALVAHTVTWARGYFDFIEPKKNEIVINEDSLATLLGDSPTDLPVDDTNIPTDETTPGDGTGTGDASGDTTPIDDTTPGDGTGTGDTSGDTIPTEETPV